MTMTRVSELTEARGAGMVARFFGAMPFLFRSMQRLVYVTLQLEEVSFVISMDSNGRVFSLFVFTVSFTRTTSRLEICARSRLKSAVYFWTNMSWECGTMVCS